MTPLKRLAQSLAHRRGLTAAAAWMSFGLGCWRGASAIDRSPAERRAALMGRAAPGAARRAPRPRA